jgi:hypothetical protein
MMVPVVFVAWVMVVLIAMLIAHLAVAGVLVHKVRLCSFSRVKAGDQDRAV